MASEHAPRTGPVRIVRMSIAHDPKGPDAVPLTIMAQLDPTPDREELQWWMAQLRERVHVRGWTTSSTGVTTLQVDAPEDQLEAVARRLLAALDEANAAYPERHGAWRREQDARVAQERQRRENRAADRQAILDQVMDEHRSDR
jgi:hypothetical protein